MLVYLGRIVKTLTERASEIAFERIGGWCEPKKRIPMFVAPELKGRKLFISLEKQVEPFRVGCVSA